jgi:hypothetical protein
MEEENIGDDVTGTDDVIRTQLKSQEISSCFVHILSFGEVEGCKNVYKLLDEVINHFSLNQFVKIR